MHSIQFRLTALFIVVTTAALAIFGMYGYYRLSHELDANFTQLQKSTVSRLTISVPAPMWDLNTEVCKTILEAEMMPPEIRAIQVFDAKNQPFIGTARDKEGRILSDTQVNVAEGIPGEAPLYRQTDVMAGAGGVQQSGPAIGRVVVHFSRDRIEYTLRVYALQSVLEVLAIDALLVFVLTLSLRMIFTPLGRLRDALHALAHQDNEEVKELPETQRNEFGEVVKGFNETQRKLKQVIERHRKAEEEARKAMEIAKNKAGALAESKLLLQATTEDLQNQVAESVKTRKTMLNILEDVETSKKEVEATVQKINAMSQAVNDALVMIDGEGKVLFWNEAAEKLFGYTASEAMGMDFHEMAAPIDVREKAHEGLRKFAATGHGILFGAAIETTAINRAGMTFPVEVNLSPFQLDEKWFAVGTVCDITERKQAEEKASIFFNATDDGLMLLSLEKGFVHGNSAAVEMLGFETLADLLRCGPAEISPEVQPDGRKSAEAAKEHIGTAMKSGTAYRFDWMHKRCDGSLLPCEVTLIPIKLPGAQLLASIRDITERKAMEQKIIAEGERLKNILDKAPINIAFSTKGRIHFANPLFAETFGAREGDPSPQLYVHPEERDALVERLKNDGIVKNFEIQMFDRQKNVRDMLITYLPINYEGEDGILGWLTDITERKQAENELKERMEDLERFSQLTINREEKMIQLKEEINSLLEQTGKEKKYKIVE